MTDTRTLFLQFDPSVWTAEELDNLLEALDGTTPDNVEIAAVSDDIEYLDEEAVEEMTDRLLENLEGDDD